MDVSAKQEATPETVCATKQPCKCKRTAGYLCNFCLSLHIADGCCLDFTPRIKPADPVVPKENE